MTERKKIGILALVAVVAALCVILWLPRNDYVKRLGSPDGAIGVRVYTDGGSLPLVFTTIDGEEAELILDRSLQEDPVTGEVASVENGELYYGYDKPHVILRT